MTALSNDAISFSAVSVRPYKGYAETSSFSHQRRSAPELPLSVAKPPRDLALDFLRGVAIFSMVTDHLLFVSGYSFVTRERIGVVTGAEIFVLISGILVGSVYKAKIAKIGYRLASLALVQRAVQLYFVCLSLVVGVFLVSLIPSFDTKLAYANGMYNLKGAVHHFGAFHTLATILLLKCGPLRMNVIGIYVVLMGGAPLVMWMLTKGYTKALLIASGLVWAANLHFQARISTTLFDGVFRVLSWQFLFVIGTVAGYHRDRIREIVKSPAGHWAIVAVAIISLGLCVFALHNPGMDLPSWARLHFISDKTFNRLYNAFFSRKVLAPGRMVNVLCLFSGMYLLLKRFWKVAEKSFAWFFVTIGQASLYVYILHVFILQGVYQMSIFNHGNFWINTAGTTAVLLTLWAMTKNKVLFWLIPR